VKLFTTGLNSRTVPKKTLIALSFVALLAAACGSSSPKALPTIPASLPAAAVQPKPSPLNCSATALRKHPRVHTTVGIDVRTTAHVWVTGADSQSPDGGKVAGRAGAAGRLKLRFAVGDVTPGTRVVVDVRVSRNGRKAHCRTSFRLREAAVVVAASPTPSPPPPSPTPAASAPSVPAPPPATAVSCHPLSDEGTCYEPGEFCRDVDHGVTGIAGDGEQITCEDNDGWRWEPS
jgi:hypothetical protein